MADLFNTGIRPAVDAWLLAKSKEERDYGDYWSASSAGYCMRKVIFDRLGVPAVKEDARKQRVFTSGDIFHKWMQDITKAAGLSIAQELELQDEELMIRGHIDDLVLVTTEKTSFTAEEAKKGIKNGFEQRLVLYDYKTQNSRAFSYKRDAMSHYHKYQLATYMYMLRKLQGRFDDKLDFDFDLLKNLTESRICKISKDDLRMSEEQLMWTPALEKEIYGYWATLNGYWKALLRSRIIWLETNLTNVKAPQWIEYAHTLTAPAQAKSLPKKAPTVGKPLNTENLSATNTSNINILTQIEKLESMLTSQDTQELYQRMAVPISPSTVLSWSKRLEDHLKEENLYTTLTETGLTTTQIILSFGLAQLDMVNELAKLSVHTAKSLTAEIAKKLPACTCADNEGGFMAREAYNPYWYDGEPCSLKWLKEFKEKGLLKI